MKLIITLLLIYLPQICFTQDYHKLKEKIRIKKASYQTDYLEADSSKKEAIIVQARNFLFQILSDSIFPTWYGTRWDFNGMSRTPKSGFIACGYFVTTTLQDVGFKIPRIYWAQQYGSYYIDRLSDQDNIYQFSNSSTDEIKKILADKGNAIYIVGLDHHVGFLIVKDQKLHFVHSNYYEPNDFVSSEQINQSLAFIDSNTHMIGRILTDTMIENWILNKNYPK